VTALRAAPDPVISAIRRIRRARRLGRPGHHLYRSAVSVPEARQSIDTQEKALKPDEIKKLEAFFKRTFKNPEMQVKARPRKDDSAEVYVGDEFLGLIYKDEEDGDYNFSMAILDIDLG
jgi:hypothetical protein